jgi:DNA-binding transcriptional MerR regulator
VTYRKTPIAARESGITYHRLISLMRYGHLAPPGRDSSGHFVWTDADLERIRQALAAPRTQRKEPAHV